MFLRSAAVLLVLSLAACGPSGGGDTGLSPQSTLTKVLQRGELIVGHEAEFPPFEFVRDGQVVGFDVDMMELLAAKLGVKLEFVNVAFDSLPEELLTGKVDLICSGMTATLERAKRVTFTNPYFETGLCLLLHRGTTDEVTKVEDLNDPRFKVVTKTGTTGFNAAQRLLPKASQYNLQKEVDCSLEVAQGKADAFVYDKYSIIANHRQHPDTTRAILEPFTWEPYSLAIRKGDYDWLNWLNQFLAEIRHTGEYDTILERWFGKGADDGEKR